jgi:hypothetical protein
MLFNNKYRTSNVFSDASNEADAEEQVLELEG